jgi:polyphosphate glucokinase
MEEAVNTTVAAEETDGATAAGEAPVPVTDPVTPSALKPRDVVRRVRKARPAKSAAKVRKVVKESTASDLAIAVSTPDLAIPAPPPKPEAKAVAKPQGPLTLAVDIGGTGMKAEKLDRKGRAITERLRVVTPKQANPQAVVRVIRKLARAQAPFDRVSVGFPGVVKNGVVYNAPNLGKGWNQFDLRDTLQRKLGKPVRVANDADVQGLGAVTGRGIELVITLGTGFGSVIFVDGHRIHLELGHAPFHRGKTYEEELGVKALRRKGKRKWNRLLREALDDLSRTFNYDRLYIGGGNARQIDFKLPADVHVVSNEEGLLGGIRLWDDSQPQSKPARKKSTK